MGRVFKFHNDEDSISVLTGLKITGGSAVLGGGIGCYYASPKISYNIIVGNAATERGGGIYCSHSDPKIIDNTIADNSAQFGGGVACYENSAPEISENSLEGNSAESSGGGIICWLSAPVITGNKIAGNSTTDEGDGGGLYLSGGSLSPLISNNDISDNTSDRDGGGIYYTGRPIIRSNRIERNWAGNEGGGLFCDNTLFGEISDNVIARNSGRNGGGVACDDCRSDITRNIIRGNAGRINGGGFYIAWSDPPKISNTIIIENEAERNGGGIHYNLYPANTGEIRNCIISGNSSRFGGGLSSSYSNVEIWNTIFWGDEAESLGKEIYINCGEWEPASVYVHNVDIEGGNESVHREIWCDFSGYRFDADPLFLNPEKGAYQLQADSPCIDNGYYNIDDACLPPGQGESRSDVGAYGGADNCGWLERSIDLLLYSGDSVWVAPGDTIAFNTIIWNATEGVAEGDFWLSVILPDLTEINIPEDFLNYPNPLAGQVSAHGSLDLSNELFVPEGASTGTYNIIGRIGVYPNTIIDEELFKFRVVE